MAPAGSRKGDQTLKELGLALCLDLLASATSLRVELMMAIGQ